MNIRRFVQTYTKKRNPYQQDFSKGCVFITNEEQSI